MYPLFYCFSVFCQFIFAFLIFTWHYKCFLPLHPRHRRGLVGREHTTFAKEFKRNPADFHLFELEEYIELAVDYLELLNPEIVMEHFANQSPFDMLIAPKWGIKNFELVAKIEKRLKERNTWQGRLFKNKY